MHENIGNIKVCIDDSYTILNQFRKALEEANQKTIFFVNAHCYNLAQKDEFYREILNDSDYVLNDGIGIGLAAKLFNVRLSENHNGTDFTPRVLEIANEKKSRVFLLGGEEGIAKKAAFNIKKRYPGISKIEYQSGFFQDNSKVISKINDFNPDILIVGMGVPLQEKWIEQFKEELNCTLLLAVGAFLDFTANKVKRAPIIFRNLKLEWVYRLIQEPKRLWKRYLLGNLLFIYYIFNKRLKER
ncbi:WecB/TagA/CpsF family glycosyltransferase [Terribacillus halophilus]|uniref:WecB/TagA/CpsF family glycosyltransferase n=1 Tax=Terribacillus halophilus TaxID=361279 RepID=UPI00398213EE